MLTKLESLERPDSQDMLSTIRNRTRAGWA